MQQKGIYNKTEKGSRYFIYLILKKASMLNPRKKFVIIIALGVGALHFIIGSEYKGPFQKFISGYLIDILLPFVVYFLIALSGIIKRKWLIALIVFDIGFAVEVLQYFHVPIFGRTFDPWDFLMYALGALLALITDYLYFSKLKTDDR